MNEQTLIAYVDGELPPDEEQQIESQLDVNPELFGQVALLFRERLLIAEVLAEEAVAAKALVESEKAADCPACSAVPSLDELPNEEIFTAYISGQLSEEEAQEVEEQLREDSFFEQEFAVFCRHRFLLAETLDGIESGLQTEAVNIKRVQSNEVKSVRAKKADGKIVRMDPRRASRRGGHRPRRAAGRMPYAGQATKPPAGNGSTLLKMAAGLICLIGGGFLLRDQLQTSPQSPRPSSPLNRPIASITHSQGSVILVSGQSPSGSVTGLSETVKVTNVTPGQSFTLGEGDSVVTADGMAVVRYQGDSTTLKIRSFSTVQFGSASGAKQVKLARGLLHASVDKQPAGHPMVLKTPHAIVEVVGTEFLLTASADRTQLEMEEGVVNVSHLTSSTKRRVEADEIILADSRQLNLGTMGPQVKGFTLIDVATKSPIPGFDPIQSGAVLNLSQLGGKGLTIRADTVPAIMENVTLNIRGPGSFPTLSQVERYYPYLITDNPAKNHWKDAAVYDSLPRLVPGTYTISAEAVTTSGKTVYNTLRFTVK